MLGTGVPDPDPRSRLDDLRDARVPDRRLQPPRVIGAALRGVDAERLPQLAGADQVQSTAAPRPDDLRFDGGAAGRHPGLALGPVTKFSIWRMP